MGTSDSDLWHADLEPLELQHVLSMNTCHVCKCMYECMYVWYVHVCMYVCMYVCMSMYVVCHVKCTCTQVM